MTAPRHALGDGCVAYPADVPPRMVEVPAPPLSREARARLAAIRAELPAGMHDGPIGVPVAADGRTITYHRATYAWHLAELRGMRAPAGRALVGAAMVVQDDTGRMLWQCRAQGMFLGGVWDVAAAGSWLPGEDLVGAAYREAREELGVTRGDLGEPVGLAVVVGPPPRGVTMLVRVRVPAGLEVSPDPREVARVRWERDPAALPQPGVWPLRLAGLRAAGLVD